MVSASAASALDVYLAVLAKLAAILVADRGANAADREKRRKDDVTEKVSFIGIVFFS
jgi:hypothetical protein